MEELEESGLKDVFKDILEPEEQEENDSSWLVDQIEPAAVEDQEHEKDKKEEQAGDGSGLPPFFGRLPAGARGGADRTADERGEKVAA